MTNYKACLTILFSLNYLLPKINCKKKLLSIEQQLQCFLKKESSISLLLQVNFILLLFDLLGIKDKALINLEDQYARVTKKSH